MMNGQYFKAQVDAGATDRFFYGVDVESKDRLTLSICCLRGSPDDLPKNLVFNRMVGTTGSMPVFKEVV